MLRIASVVVVHAADRIMDLTWEKLFIFIICCCIL
jgi:hypothetical protein